MSDRVATPAPLPRRRGRECGRFELFGPVIEARLDPHGLTVRTLIDGRERRTYPVSAMVSTFPELTSSLSRDTTEAGSA